MGLGHFTKTRVHCSWKGLRSGAVKHMSNKAVWVFQGGDAYWRSHLRTRGSFLSSLMKEIVNHKCKYLKSFEKQVQVNTNIKIVVESESPI